MPETCVTPSGWSCAMPSVRTSSSTGISAIPRAEGTQQLPPALDQRIVILRGELWPVNDRLPSPIIRGWIEEQLRHGLEVSAVRESDLVMEADLLCDFAIYGDRATGIQELDEPTAREGAAAEERYLNSYPFDPHLTDVLYSRSSSAKA